MERVESVASKTEPYGEEQRSKLWPTMATMGGAINMCPMQFCQPVQKASKEMVPAVINYPHQFCLGIKLLYVGCAQCVRLVLTVGSEIQNPGEVYKMLSRKNHLTQSPFIVGILINPF